MKDNNSVSQLYGISSVDGTTMIPLQIDPITGGVLAEIVIVDPTTPVLSDRALKDNNGVSAMLGQSNHSDNVLPLMIDNRNGYIFSSIIKK